LPFQAAFFDLDDTLYPAHTGLWTAIRQRMNDYLLAHLDMSPEAINQLRHEYFIRYGTTLRGLQLHHQVDTDDFLAYVHDLPIPEFLQPDLALRTMLLSLRLPRWIFTNADAQHAQRVLARLGVSDCFNGIIDIRRMGFYCKPMPEAYQLALELAGVSDPQRCLLLDDAPRNLAPGRATGFFTILVGGDSAHPVGGEYPPAHLNLSAVTDLPQALPELWDVSA
jgi:putative hydrolase of the HAD superfamily